MAYIFCSSKAMAYINRHPSIEIWIGKQKSNSSLLFIGQSIANKNLQSPIDWIQVGIEHADLLVAEALFGV